ncbi:head GIN domain-containing protein [Bacteroidota bacterium]
MKKIIGLFILGVCLIGYSSCEKVKGKGETVNQTRNVTGFTRITLAIDASLYFSPDSTYYVEVIAQQNILDILETVIGADNTLIVRYKDGVIVGTHEPIKIFIAAPDIQKLAITGSGDILVDTPWLVQNIGVTISGSGNVNISELDPNEFYVNISGSGNLVATSGTVNYQELKISGSGNIDMLGVESDTTVANISGAGNIKVWVNKLLDVSISGSGNVSYKGDPEVKTHISGSGSVIKL